MNSDGVTIDANCISPYLKTEFEDETSLLRNLINCFLNTHGLAITEGIEQEWRGTAGGQLFNIWFDDNLKSGKIVYVEVNRKLDSNEKKRLRLKYGFPGGKDFKYIDCCLNTILKYLLTNDIHFYEPRASSNIKEKIKCERKGKFCQFLKKNYGMTVARPEHCIDDFALMEIPLDIDS